MGKFNIRPLADGEKKLFFAMTAEEDVAYGCLGHIRMDFGRNGGEFWNTWWPRIPNEQFTPEFKSELNAVMDQLRENVLSGMVGMRRFCADNGGYMDGGWAPNYGYVIDTANYRYCLRCIHSIKCFMAYVNNSVDIQKREMYNDRINGICRNKWR